MKSNLSTFVATIPIPGSADAVFDWHEAPKAFERLTPPGKWVRVLRHDGGIGNGACVLLRIGPWPLSLQWELEHRDYHYGRSFTDVQISGPFRSWKHQHRMISQGPDRCILEDSIEYELPCGRIGRVVGGALMQRRLTRLFAYRHAVTLQAFGG